MNAVNPIELHTANSTCEEKSGGTTDQTMFSLSWDVEELKNISIECRQMYSELTGVYKQLYISVVPSIKRS